MRRHRKALKYWTLIRLWWLGLRRPTRLALSGTLAALVLGTAMPLTAAVSTDAQPAEAETSSAPATPENAGGESAGADDDAESLAAEPTQGDTVPGEASDESDESNVATGETPADAPESDEDPPADETQGDGTSGDSADGTRETGDVTDEPAGYEAPADDTATDEPSADGEPATEDEALVDEAKITPTDAPGEGDSGPAADAGSTDHPKPTVDTPPAEPAPAEAPVVEETLDALDAEIVAEQTQDTVTAALEPAPDTAPVIKDGATAQKQAARTEKRERKARAAEVGFSILTSWLTTYTVDADLPKPARAPAISSGFAKRLTAAADRHGADWALVLGAVRALDYAGASPADEDLLDLLARKLAGVERSASVDEFRQSLTLVPGDAADALALARYHRAAGIAGLVDGLDGARDTLEQRVLDHPEITLLPEGRYDIERGRVGVRVLVTLLYLADRHDDVVVSSLKTGHRIFARPGVVSAHVYGQAVDIAALDGRSILGNQGPGSVTEIAVRDLLALPAGVQPKQIISLHDMGGASLADADDHHDHIHIGF